MFPATVYIEGTELSEGRGTTSFPSSSTVPRSSTRMPWAAEPSENSTLPGVAFREAYFRPTFAEFNGETCGGVQIHITDREIFTPVIVGIAMGKYRV